ncbi:MAG: glycosyltransferase family 2 protein [Muribaculaceae bacterium]|nr:glycosyltransferase family 2 protein [Muribaculaceae bacterium]
MNYHTSDQVADCVRSIRELSSGFNYEIIIVDNDSEPDLEARFAADDCRVVMLPENVGFGRANNAGFEVARGRYLFCLNPDTVLLNNAVKILLDFMEATPAAWACGANLYGADMRPTHSFRRMLPGFFWEFDEFCNRRLEHRRFGADTVFNTTGRPLEVGYITGADLMLRRDVIERIGGFDPDFFMYFEETDLCARIQAAGGKIYSVPEARIQHLEGGSFEKVETVSEARIMRSEAGRRVYWRKHFNPLQRAAIGAVRLGTLLTRVILLPPSPKRTAWRLRLKAF